MQFAGPNAKPTHVPTLVVVDPEAQEGFDYGRYPKFPRPDRRHAEDLVSGVPVSTLVQFAGIKSTTSLGNRRGPNQPATPLPTPVVVDPEAQEEFDHRSYVPRPHRRHAKDLANATVSAVPVETGTPFNMTAMPSNQTSHSHTNHTASSNFTKPSFNLSSAAVDLDVNTAQQDDPVAASAGLVTGLVFGGVALFLILVVLCACCCSGR